MDTTTSLVLTGGVVALGQWSQKKSVSIRMFVGIGFVAIILAALNNANPKLASQFAALILVAALLMNVIPISKAFGFTK